MRGNVQYAVIEIAEYVRRIVDALEFSYLAKTKETVEDEPVDDND
jgi:hypothetical protein